MHPYLRYATEKQAEIIDSIRQMVELESPSDSPVSVNRLTDWIAAAIEGLGKAKLIRAGKFGNHLRLEFKLSGRKKTGQVLALGHSDTVWPLGTLETMPFREAEGRLWGPGVLDMKAGLAFALHAVRLLRDLDAAVPSNIVLLIVSDEEVGSETSRAITEAEAQKSHTVLVLEPGTGLTGKLKTSRKGVGDYSISIHGKASHAGVDFSSGASAILEAARQITHIATFTDLDRGITVNPGVIFGGTRTNVIAAQARVDFDIRVQHLKDAAGLEKKFRSLQPFDKRCTLHVEGGLNRPPMERSKGIAALFQRAKQLGSDLGLTLEESATGGGSDGNFTAALGIPTLDGLGAVGEGAHADNESILVDRIADRTALLALLFANATGPASA